MTTTPPSDTGGGDFPEPTEPTDSTATVTPEQMEAARLAGWNPADGPPPFEHALPPEDDPDLGNNGIPPTDAPRVA